MYAVLEIDNQSDDQRVWNVDGEFSALIKCYVQRPGDKKLQIIEKPSTRPATLHECYRFSQKLKQEYGNSLKRMIIWNMDELNKKFNLLK